MKMNYGQINGHIIGRVLKETVRRATVVIRNERQSFDSTIKESYDGDMTDVCTSADKKAQEVYLRALTECFPDCGIVGEEDGLLIPALRGDAGPYFTVDPLDGTKAYTRRQSHGVASMVALVHGQTVMSAYIGDINTEEVYGYRPDSGKVHRITRLDTAEELSLESGDPLEKRYALLRDPSSEYSRAVQELLPRFKSHEVIGSSIGTWMAQLWKGEVAAAFMRPGWETPWDMSPVVGISKKLGCVFLRPDRKGGWVEYEPRLAQKKYRREHESLVIHRSYLSALGI